MSFDNLFQNSSAKSNTLRSLCFIGLILIMELGRMHCLTIQVNNIHNGYKYIAKGIPKHILGTKLLHLTEILILQDTLPQQQSIQEILNNSNQNKPNQLSLVLQNLSQITELQYSDYQQVILTRWIQRPQYSVSMSLEQQEQGNQKLYNFIKQNTIPPEGQIDL